MPAVASPRFTYTDEDLAIAREALFRARGNLNERYEDRQEWEAVRANTEADAETVLEAIGGRHIDAVLERDQ